MTSDWYCKVENGTREVGPFTDEQLRKMARTGRLTRDDSVRRGASGTWVLAGRAKGLFDEEGDAAPPAAEAQLVARRATEPSESNDFAWLRQIDSIHDCLSPEERKKRGGMMLANGLVWLLLILLTIASFGFLLIIYAVGWVVHWFLSEYNVRKLQALGTTATREQFPEIEQALNEVCEQFDLQEIPQVIVLNVGEVNALAVKFARRKVIVLFSETVEGIVDKPAQLRFILGHELAHILLDHGRRGTFEIIKPAAYRAARELTCDNCGVAAAGDLAASKSVLKRLGVGNVLHKRLDEEFLISEADHIYSGMTGWLLKQYLTYPPLGKRISNLNDFCARE